MFVKAGIIKNSPGIRYDFKWNPDLRNFQRREISPSLDNRQDVAPENSKLIVCDAST